MKKLQEVVSFLSKTVNSLLGDKTESSQIHKTAKVTRSAKYFRCYKCRGIGDHARDYKKEGGQETKDGQSQPKPSVN